MVDWPGHIADVIHLSGCNWSCPWCQNKTLWEPNSLPDLYLSDVLENLQRMRNLPNPIHVDSVVITGGEPTIHGRRLWDLIARIYAFDIGIKLDTNGSNPLILDCLTSSGLIQCVALDVKAPGHKYPQTIGRPEIPCDEISQTIHGSIYVLKEWGGEVIFRTTRLLWMTDEDIHEIEYWVFPYPLVIQEYREVTK
jgi:pyruvate formate lyase activating enzyme